MEIIIFGVGQIYREKKRYISNKDHVVGFLDNNEKLWGSKIDGVRIYNPDKILELSFDKIVLMSDYALEMRTQLINLNCGREKIVHYLEYIGAQCVEEDLLFISTERKERDKERCLIITTDLEYNGGSIAAVYAALALKKKGYESVIAAPRCDLRFVEEVKNHGINVLIYPYLSHTKELSWTDDFQHVVVNTLQMSCCAIEISRRRKVVLWIHEPHNLYEVMSYWKEDIQEGILEKNIKVYAVSQMAKNNFLQNFAAASIDLLPYGIPDRYIEKRVKKDKKESFTFAMIGLISEQKGQDIFIEAIERLGIQKNVSFLIIGKNLEDAYGKSIKKRLKGDSYVQVLGEISHEDVIAYWNDIDVLVVPSREDMLPIVATEAMMMGKVCLLSDVAGTVKYVEDNTNGLIFQTKNSYELSDKMRWCIENKEMLKRIGESARETYEKYFSIDVFGANLEEAIRK